MPEIKNISGQRFGRLVAVEPTAKRSDRKVVWVFRCDCGKIVEISGKSVRNGNTRSCGCLHDDLRPEVARKAATVHGHAIHGRETPTWYSWRAAKGRCFNPKDPAYARYGGMGITMCARWRDSFEAFLADMGPRPSGRTIDRYPNKHGNYEPGNCRWATPFEQTHNRRILRSKP